MPGKNAGWTNGRWVPDSYCVDIRSNQLRSHIFQFSEMWCRQINWTTQLLPEGAETGERDVSYFICNQWVSVHVLNSEMVKMLIYTLKYARRYPKCGLFQPKMMKNNSHSVPGQGGGRLWPEKEAGKRGPPQIPHLVSWQSGPAWFWVPVARKGGWSIGPPHFPHLASPSPHRHHFEEALFWGAILHLGSGGHRAPAPVPRGE